MSFLIFFIIQTLKILPPISQCRLEKSLSFHHFAFYFFLIFSFLLQVSYPLASLPGTPFFHWIEMKDMRLSLSSLRESVGVKLNDGLQIKLELNCILKWKLKLNYHYKVHFNDFLIQIFKKDLFLSFPDAPSPCHLSEPIIMITNEEKLKNNSNHRSIGKYGRYLSKLHSMFQSSEQDE